MKIKGLFVFSKKQELRSKKQEQRRKRQETRAEKKETRAGINHKEYLQSASTIPPPLERCLKGGVVHSKFKIQNSKK